MPVSRPRPALSLSNGSSVLAGEPAQPEKLDIVPRLAALGQIGQDFADDAGEFEAVAGTGRGKTDLGVGGVQVNDKMLIGRVGEHAAFERHGRAAAFGEVAGGKFAQGGVIVGARLAFHLFGRGGFLKMVVHAKLKTGHGVDRKTVVRASAM